MIPKIIHYVWLGGKDIPENLRTYMDSWRQMMPTWEVRGWTEINIPAEVLAVPYVQQALSARKFAFASDYIRLWALEQFGGVYLDTDVEVLRSFDNLPEFTPPDTNTTTNTIKAFIGFEESIAHLPGTCVMGCEPHCQWVRDMLKTYDDACFRLEVRGKSEEPVYDLTTNVQRMGKAMVEKYGLVPNGKEQFLTIKNQKSSIINHVETIHVYDHHYFSPITSTRVMRKNKNTFTIHHFAGSWTGTGHGHWYDHPVCREVINALIQVKRFIKGKK